MATSTTILIIVAAVVAVLVIAGLIWMARNKRNQQRHVEADKIREDARQQTLLVKQHEALADETAARARAAQAEADVKAAQASGLQQQAAVHRGEAVTSRDHLNEQWDRADTLDPASRAASDTGSDAHDDAHDEPRPTAGSR
jgi:FtsZ-interacting cell division protein ZipA